MPYIMEKPSTGSVVLPFIIESRLPSLEEFTELIQAVGWERYTNMEVLAAALAGSLFGVVAVHEGRIIGTGRILGDGARHFTLNDIMVHPDFQRRGVGTAIVDALMDYLNEHAPRKAYIHLFTEKAKAPFYERYGFGTPFTGLSTKKFDKRLGRDPE